MCFTPPGKLPRTTAPACHPKRAEILHFPITLQIARSTAGRGISLLWLGHSEANPLHPRQSAEGIRSRRLGSAGHREITGVPDRSQRLLLLRSGVEGILPVTTTAHHRAGQRIARARLSRRDRSHRSEKLTMAMRIDMHSHVIP